MHVVTEMPHCFINCITDNQRGRSDNKVKKDVLKQGVKETNILSKIFAGNESIIKTRNKEHQYTEDFAYSRFLLHFYLLSKILSSYSKANIQVQKERKNVSFLLWTVRLNKHIILISLVKSLFPLSQSSFKYTSFCVLYPNTFNASLRG